MILASTIKKFEFTKLVYVLILFHSFILMVGGHTTYAEMPLFNWIRDSFGLKRNYYDRLGHFAQGFVPALVAREYFIRRKIIASRKWLNFIVVMFLLGFAAFYEFIEWWVSLASGSKGDAFLGTQGDIWDTQSDMFMCFVGSIIAIVFFAKLHDRLIKKME
jgi:putative membrane protein